MTSSAIGIAGQQYRVIHDIAVLLDDGDQRLLRDFNLTASQYAVLTLLDAEAGWRHTDLSERLRLDKSTVTRIVDRLMQASLVQRIADPLDRRAQRVVLTAVGVALRDRTHEAHLASLMRRMAVLDGDEQQQLQRLLDKLRSGLHADLESQGASPGLASDAGKGVVAASDLG